MSRKQKRTYLDFGATTPVDSLVKKEMDKWWAFPANASSLHVEGRRAERALFKARVDIARALSVKSREIIFTSGGTESNNLALNGVLSVHADLRRLDADKRRIKKGGALIPHIVTTNIEHSSVLEPIREFERRGVAVTYVSVESNGIVDPKKIADVLRPETILVSVGYANNEIGTVQPIREISQLIKVCKSKNVVSNLKNYKLPQVTESATADSLRGKQITNYYPIFHSDASQAPLYLPVSPHSLGVDLMTFDAHKIYGPQGIGALFVRDGVELSPIFFGGGQEKGLRVGTEPIALIVGFAKAFSLAVLRRKSDSARLLKLRDYAILRIFSEIPDTILNGDLKKRLPNNMNISISGISGEAVVVSLDEKGVAVSSKSACLSDEKESYVIRALGGSHDRAMSAVRFSLGRGITRNDIQILIKVLSETVARLRILNGIS